MSSHPVSLRAPRGRAGDGASGAVWKVVALLLGFAVGVLAIAAVVAMQAADQARDEAGAAAGGQPIGMQHDHSAHVGASTAQSLPLQSFAGTTAPNADALAKAHPAYDA